MAVSLILKRLSEGATAEDLVKAYPNLTLTSINAVLAYVINQRLTHIHPILPSPAC